MRILVANKFLYPRAGAEAYALQTITALRERGHEVAIFGMGGSVAFEADDIEVVPDIELGARSSAATKAWMLGRLALTRVTGVARRHLRAQIARFDPDVVHAHNVYNQLPVDVFAEVDVPVVLTVHDYKPVCPSYNCFRDGDVCERCIGTGGDYSACVKGRCVQGSALRSWLAARDATKLHRRAVYARDYSRLITPSRFLADLLVRDGMPEERVTVLHNFTQACRPAPDAGRDGIFCAGRFTAEKGVDVLLRAFARLPRETRPPLRLAGEGPAEDELRRLAVQRGVDDVEWLGFCSREDIEREYARAAIVVVPSRWNENCPMSVLEALAHGATLVATRSGGIPEIVTDATGVLVERSDADAMATALAELLADGPRRRELGRAAATMVAERFAERQHMNALEDIYAEEVDVARAARSRAHRSSTPLPTG